MPGTRRAPFILLAYFLLAVTPSMVAIGHPGGLDSQGCHVNRNSGDYHCHRASQASESRAAMDASSDADGPPVKLSNSGVCHDSSSPWYLQTKTFTAFASMEACIKAGGRRPKG
jgi:hypothetical protein